MASVSGEKYCDSAVNVPAYVGISSFSATRKSATSTTVTLKFKVYVYTSSSGGYSYNSLCVWVDDGSKRTVFNSNSGSVHTTKGKKYYTSEITLTKTVRLGSTTTSFTVGVNGTSWNPSSPKKTFTFKVSGIPKGSYTVTYDANGGTGAPGNQTKWYDEDLILSGTKPTRYGYAFQGWLVPSRYGSTFDDIYYQPGGLNRYNGNQTLVAYWRKWIGLKFDANSGSGAPSEIVATVDNAVTTYTFTIPNTTPTRIGYNFLGWGTASSDTTAKYKSGDKITLEYTTTLYAIWQLKTYTITYNANGGSGAPSAQTKRYGINLSLSTTRPTRTGYDFLGWGVNTTSVSYNSGGTITSNADTTLYAIWKLKEYTIAYNVNGGSGTIYSQTKTYGITLTLTTLKPTRTGYNFLGWSTNSASTTATYTSGSSFTTNADTTLYAIWQIQTFVVSYNANGGVNTPSNQTKTYGVTLKLSTIEPSRSGYKFLGWSTSASSKTPSYLSGANFTTNATTTLYAVWEQLGIAYMNVNGTFQAGRVWVNDNGTWMTGIIFVNDNGTWTQGGI